jgi:hypothetical protein
MNLNGAYNKTADDDNWIIYEDGILSNTDEYITLLPFAYEIGVIDGEYSFSTYFNQTCMNDY